MSKLDELVEKFVYELRLTIGYSGGASDRDIITCETVGGRQASMRFDVLSKSLVEIVRKLLTEARLEEREYMLKNPAKFTALAIEGAVRAEREANNLERLIEKCGEKGFMLVFRPYGAWNASVHRQDKNTNIVHTEAEGSTPTEAVENLIKELNNK